MTFCTSGTLAQTAAHETKEGFRDPASPAQLAQAVEISEHGHVGISGILLRILI